jgi:hypothetical protein
MDTRRQRPPTRHPATARRIRGKHLAKLPARNRLSRTTRGGQAEFALDAIRFALGVTPQV